MRGRKSGRQLPIPAVAGVGPDDLWAAVKHTNNFVHYIQLYTSVVLETLTSNN